MLRQLSLRAVVALGVRCVRRLKVPPIAEAAISIAEDYAEGREIDSGRARQAANAAAAAGHEVAADAARAAIAANTRGGFPGAPQARREAFSIVAKIVSCSDDPADVTAVEQDFQLLLAKHKSTFPRFGAPVDLRKLGADHAGLLIQTGIILLGDKTNEGQLVDLAAVPWFEIARELERDVDFLFKFDWRKMEELVAAAYKRVGCPEVILTPRSNDGGRDVIATWPGVGSIRIMEQVKKYKPGHKVTADDVRAMLGVLNSEQNVSKGVVTTTSAFAPGIYEDEKLSAFMPHRLELKDGNTLRDWLKGIAKGP